MKLVAENNRIFLLKCIPFDFEDPVMDPYELSDALQKIRREGGGIGLAAPQVGIDTQALVIGMGNFETKEAQEFERTEKAKNTRPKRRS